MKPVIPLKLSDWGFSDFDDPGAYPTITSYNNNAAKNYNATT
jgi:hypothetical protein